MQTARGGRRWGRWLVNSAAGLVAAVLLVEATLWLLPRAWLPDGFALLDRVYTARNGWYRMMMGDPYLGYKLKPGLDLMFPSEGRSIPVRTENYDLGEVGFRDVGTQPPFDGVAVGGSFTLCDDVPAESCWVRLLSEAVDGSIATLGVNGYSTLASARMLDRYGRRLGPKFVLVDVFLNDFKDNINFDRWSRSGSDNFWAWLGERRGRSEVGRWFSEYSMIYRVLDGAARARNRRIRTYREDGLDFVFRLDGWWLQLIERPEGTPAWGLMQQALLRVRDTSKDMGAKPMVLLFPMKEEIYWERIRDFAPDLAHKNVGHPFDVIRAFCEAQGIAYCDLRGPLRSEAQKGRQLYHRISSHWNDAGNVVAAAAIERCLREQGFVGPAGS
jgi:hypothetical protein